MRHKFFNDRKYGLKPKSNRWVNTTDGKPLSHDIWNFYHPGDPILKGDGYVIHHENGDSSDDRIENLQKMKLGEHTGIHNSSYTFTDEAKQKMSDAKLGHVVTDETKQKIRDMNLGNKNPRGMLGRSHTDETKQKIRNAVLGDKNPNWKGGKRNDK